jgi:cobalt-zinc-cadmium efflux system protein
MSHDHDHDHDHRPPADLGPAFRWAVGLNVGYVIVEATAGFLTGSLALLADRIRSIPDTALEVYVFGPAERMLADPDKTDFNAQIGAEDAFRVYNMGLESAAVAFPRFAAESATVISF